MIQGMIGYCQRSSAMWDIFHALHLDAKIGACQFKQDSWKGHQRQFFSQAPHGGTLKD
jgi:hypothetical protein